MNGKPQNKTIYTFILKILGWVLQNNKKYLSQNNKSHVEKIEWYQQWFCL